MANVIFSSPTMSKDVTVYAVAGDTRTILAVAEAHKIKKSRATAATANAAPA